MKRSRLLVTAITTVLLIAVVVLVSVWLTADKPMTQLLQSLPNDAVVVVTMREPAKVFEQIVARQKNISKLLDSIKHYQRLIELIKYLDKTIDRDHEASHVFAHSQVGIAMHVADSTPVFTIAIVTSDNDDAYLLQSYLTQRYNATLLPSTFKEKNVQTYMWSLPNNGSWYITFVENIIYISFSSDLAIKAVQQYYEHISIASNNDFMQLVEVAGKNVDANLYINHKQYEAVKIKLPVSNMQMSNLLYFASWSGLDVSIKDSSLIINGFTQPVDKKYLSLFSRSDNRKATITIAPAQTDVWINVQTTSVEELCKYAQLYGYNTSIWNELNSLFYNEIGFGQMYFDTALYNYTICSLSDATASTQKIRQWLDKNHTTNYQNNIRVDADTSWLIYRLPQSDSLIARFLKTPNQQYVSFVGSFAVLTNTQEAMLHVIRRYLTGNTLDKNNTYSTNATLTANEYIKQLYWQIEYTPQTDWLYCNMQIDFAPVFDSGATTLWKSRLDTTINMKPALLWNKQGDKDILVQDVNNKIYLLNNGGRVVWSKKFDEPVIGTVSQINPYLQNKVLIMFATPSRIYLLDHDGNIVPSYPVELPAKAVTGVVSFDKNAEGEYVLLVGCDNQKVLAYNMDGSSYEKWQFEKAESDITGDIQIFEFQGIRKIAFADRLNNYILNDDGTKAILLQQQFARADRVRYVLDVQNNRFVSTSTNGTVYFIYPDGKLETKQLCNVSPLHFFDYTDVNADRKPDFLFADNNAIMAFDDSGAQIFSQTLPEALEYQPSVYYFPMQQRKLGLVLHKAGKILLINPDGSTSNGFPIVGETPFSIGYLQTAHKTFYLITSKGNFLYAYNVNL